MDGGGHGRTEERAAEKLMDDYLKSLGLARKKIAKDGSCLFRAVAEQVLHCQSLHSKVRAECVKFLKLNREVYEAFIEGDFEDYVLKLRDPQQWVGEVEINALAAMYKRDFLIFQEPGKPAVNITDNNYEDKVQLCFLNGNHYDSVYPIKRIKNAAVCQSILYEMLYDKVFKVERGALSLCQRTGRPHDLLSDDNMPACPSSDESDLETGDALWVENGTSSSSTRHQSHRGRGRGRQLPERVRRSLNPTLFRNIDYDVWHKTKRAQQKLDFCIAAGMQFTVGDRCQVRLEGSGRSYNATIKEVPPNDNQVVVFIEELGRRNVPLWWLSPLSDDSSWSAVVNKDKRLSNGHGEWEEKGKGRGRGKHAAAAAAAAAASAAGSSGRVQKQRSVEEQGGSKPSRKSMSSMETTAFGLTEEERLAKKEEELNVALVEIQLRDENSFPALGTQTAAQGDGGKKKGGEKKKLQRNKTKSPVEDVRAASPSAGERPKSSSPPHVSAAATTSTTTAAAAAAAAAPVDPAPAWLSSIKAPAPNVNMAASGSTSTRAATTPKTSASSYTSAAETATSSPPPVVQSVPASANIFSLLTPALPAASSPPTPPASSSSSSSSPSKSTVSPPPSSSVPPPTFIAPIAPSPCLLPLSSSSSSSLPRSSPPVSSLLHSPSPSITSSTSSSSLIHHAAQIQEAPPAAAQTTSVPKSGASVVTQTSQNQISASQTQTQTSHNQVDVQTPVVNIQTQNQVSLAQTQVLMPQMQTEAQASVPQAQHQSQSLTDVALPQNQIQGSIIQPQSQVHYPSQQPQMVHTPPGVYYPPTQAPAPVQPHPQPQSLPTHPPHPSQPPPPSHPVSTSPAHPPLQSQTPNTQNQTEAPQTPHPPSQHHLPAGGVPLEKLCQLYQDPLYPGFPQGEKGDIVPNPPFSLNKSGEDLPRDVNILRFFFNLGVKAYTMPLYPPYLYLLPLQQTYTVNPRPPSPSPSCSPAPTPHFPPPNAPIRHQEAYAPYHPTPASLPPQFDHQAPLPEPPRPSEPSFDQGRGHVPQPPPPRMSWQQHRQMAPHRNPSYPTGFPSGPLPYPVPPPSSQVYHPGQGPAHPPPSQQPYPPTLSPPYPPASMGYPPSSHPEELQVSQGGVMEQLQHTNGDTMAGHGLGRVPGALEGSAANMANANNKRLVVANNFAMKEQGDGSTRAVLLIDPPLNKEQIDALVSSVDMSASMKPGGAPSSSSPYRFPHKMSGDVYQAQHHKLYKQHKPYAKTTEGMSVGCSTEDDWEETEGFKPTTLTYRGSKRGHRGGGGRGRGGSGNYEGGRGRHRRPQEGFNHNQFSPSQRGRGW